MAQEGGPARAAFEGRCRLCHHRMSRVTAPLRIAPGGPAEVPVLLKSPSVAIPARICGAE